MDPSFMPSRKSFECAGNEYYVYPFMLCAGHVKMWEASWKKLFRLNGLHHKVIVATKN